MDKIKKKKKIISWITIAVLVAWAIFLFNVDIEILVASIGITNMYLILFLVSAVSSTSFLTSASFYATFFAYIYAGFDPIIISVIGGIGMSVGDSLFFVVSRNIGSVIRLSGSKLYNKMFNFVSQLPTKGVYLFTYLYASFAPTPNDILIIMLGILKFRYSRIIPILIIGNITLLFLISHGFNLFL